MSEQNLNPTKPGPAIPTEIDEVQAIFPSNAALEDAIGRLRLAGFDHADLSLPHATPDAADATPEQGADDPLTEDDARQHRTMRTSMAAAAAGMLGAGLTVATGGGAALAAGAAAAAGLGAGAVSTGATSALQHAERSGRDEAAQRGELVLAVRVTTAEQRSRAEQVMRECGATGIEGLTRRTAAVDSAGWTG